MLRKKECGCKVEKLVFLLYVQYSDSIKLTEVEL